MIALRCSCQQCHEHCGELAVYEAGDALVQCSTRRTAVERGPFVSITGFMGHITAYDHKARLGEIKEAMTGGDLGRLHAIDRFLVPFYCPQCGCCYCRKHWTCTTGFDPDGGAYEDTRGTCPMGHTRVLDD